MGTLVKNEYINVLKKMKKQINSDLFIINNNLQSWELGINDFALTITTSNNLSLRICCRNVVKIL